MPRAVAQYDVAYAALIAFLDTKSLTRIAKHDKYTQCDLLYKVDLVSRTPILIFTIAALPPHCSHAR